MREKSYKRIRTIGGGSIALGIVLLLTGIVCGTLMIINGGKLLAEKFDRLI